MTALYRDTLDIEWVEVEHTVAYRLDGLPVGYRLDGFPIDSLGVD